ncbi:MAG: type IV secretion system DNA-binding domain-containing protein [Drouetiella hepatica Uher 2000/2452]|jgi:type IV secretory pathway TraG/TraD family ATPase VirD4|uniref:Type IV secretion system DNA-binding domain-containing protein n=1 Tax=Drouetiella hepatica Uher 2000/2452 TaxID=904376 RepID=A0A951QCX3_9CYAN|nr:type IV secretion system DNA-binding domain-containing protein [Drouetiella hepatica Uher 2000/2452]
MLEWKNKDAFQITVLALTGFVSLAAIGIFEKLKLSIHSLFSLNEQSLSHTFLGWHWILERACLVAYLFSILIYQTKYFENIQKSSSGEAFRRQQRIYEFGWFVLFAVLPIVAFPICISTLKSVLRPESAYTLTCLICAGFSLLLTFNERKRKSTTIRGEELLTHEEAIAISETITENSDRAFYWGGLWLPIEDSSKHMLIIGEPGSGKSKTLSLFMETVLPHIGHGLDQRAIIYDPKRNTRSLLAGMELEANIKILDPFDKRSTAWNLAADVDEPDIARTVAEALIPEEGNASQPYFRDTAAVIVCAVMQALHIRKPYAWTLRDLVLVMRSGETITKLVSSVPETKHYVDQHCNQVGQAFQSVLSTAAGKIDWLTSVAALWDKAEEKISLRDWVSNQESILLLGSDNLRVVAMSQLNRMILTYLTLAVLDLPDNDDRRVWFLLDEFTSLGKIKKVQDLLYKGRSKGASVVIAFQEVAQLIEHYGREGQRIITANTANKVFLRSSDPETQKWEQTFFGIQEKYEESHSKNASLLGTRASFGKSEAIRERSLVLASEFGSLNLASRAKGISGFAKNPSIGSYRFNIAGHTVDKVSRPDPEIPNFLEKDAKSRKIRTFDQEEEATIYGVSLEINEPNLEEQSYSKKRKHKIRESIQRMLKDN